MHNRRFSWREFQSTHPMRGATCVIGLCVRTINISIHAPHAGCDLGSGNITIEGTGISIRAPHAGCDSENVRFSPPVFNFNPRTPCGVRRICPCSSSRSNAFQSAHPMRGATSPTSARLLGNPFQSAHPMRGATKFKHLPAIHSAFQSAHPMRGATRLRPLLSPAAHISIRAPHAGCDMRGWTMCIVTVSFQSAHPMRGATGRSQLSFSALFISIRAPHAGCDA